MIALTRPATPSATAARAQDSRRVAATTAIDRPRTARISRRVVTTVVNDLSPRLSSESGMPIDPRTAPTNANRPSGVAERDEGGGPGCSSDVGFGGWVGHHWCISSGCDPGSERRVDEVPARPPGSPAPAPGALPPPTMSASQDGTLRSPGAAGEVTFPDDPGDDGGPSDVLGRDGDRPNGGADDGGKGPNGMVVDGGDCPDCPDAPACHAEGFAGA